MFAIFRDIYDRMYDFYLQSKKAICFANGEN